MASPSTAGLDRPPGGGGGLEAGHRRDPGQRDLAAVRVHFMRNLLAQVPKGAQPPVAVLVRTIFAQPGQAAARAHLRKVVVTLEHRHPKAATLLADAEENVLAYMSFPEKHRRRLHSRNLLERLHKEIKCRRT